MNVRPSRTSWRHELSFLRQPDLAQAFDENCWRQAHILPQPFDGQLRIEATGLGQGDFSLGVAPLRGLRPRQKGVRNIGSETCVDRSLEFRNSRVNPTTKDLANAEVHVPETAE